MVYDVRDMLRAYRERPASAAGKLIQTVGVNGWDAYNPSGALAHEGQRYFYARTEPRDDEFDSWAALFRQDDEHCWEADIALPMLRLQDPFVQTIHGRLIVGGVRILARSGIKVFFETVLLTGDSVETLSEFARGPLNMKDIRLVELERGRVGIFTRPLGGEGGRGRIGYTEVDGLEHVTTAAMEQAPLLPTQPIPEQWWGANHAWRLSDTLLGVLAHIAMFTGDDRHYYPVAFVLDRQQRTIVEGPWILAERQCFPPGPAKRETLVDVIFPAWMDRENGLLYAGLSDAAVGVLELPDPFAHLAE